MIFLFFISCLFLFNSCDNPIKNNTDVDCIIDLGGFYDDCGICSGGISEHEPNSDEGCEYICTNGVKDNCGECNMNNSSMDLCNICFGQNTTCNQGLLSKSNWNFQGIKLWNNMECEGNPYYTIDNELCILDSNENLKCFTYSFNFTDEIYMVNNLEYFIFNQEILYDDTMENFQGLWRISNAGLCLIFDNTATEECYSLIDFKNNYYDCQGDDIYLCENNEVSLLSKNIDTQTCSKEIFNADDRQSTNRAIIEDKHIRSLPPIIKNILLNQKNIYE
tara:strand:+ start:2801 stop:3631 length:831 start_codon:yes stop_codon:yes gene_type:complete